MRKQIAQSELTKLAQGTIVTLKVSAGPTTQVPVELIPAMKQAMPVYNRAKYFIWEN